MRYPVQAGPSHPPPALVRLDVPPGKSRRFVGYGLLVAVVTAVWLIPGVVCALQVFTNRFVTGGAAYDWASIWWYALPPWLGRVPTTLLILWLAHRVRLDGPHRVGAALVHGAASLVLGLVNLGFYAYWLGVAAPYEVPAMPWSERTMGLVGGAWLHFAVLAYWGTVGAYYAFDYARKYRDRALQASRLEARLAEAQLHALRMQLHPHFLFNTLNAISTLVLKEETAGAGRMINRLSDFLRATLEGRSAEVSLEEEVDFTAQYLAIEQCRFGERLRVDIEVEPAVRGALVPSLLLQPLVENAVRHGIAPRERGGRLRVTARRAADALRLTVEDDGPGLSAAAASGHGIGLANTRARLAQRYGEAHRFALDTSPLGGLRATIELPFERAPAGGDGSLRPLGEPSHAVPA